MQSPISEQELEALAEILGALAHPRRLELLAILREPRRAGEIELRPWRHTTEHSPDRAISRSAVERHLHTLETIGVVARTPAPRGKGAEEYVLDHARLFAIVEGMRSLTRLRPTVDLDSRETMDALRPIARRTPRPEGPHVVLIGGPTEGHVVPLVDAGPWRIGRAADSDVKLDHDPFVSATHAEIARANGSFTVRDLAANRNGTSVNWSLLARGGSVEIASGDVIGAGRSLLLFRDRR